MARARRVIPGGVNSPVRAYGAVGGTAPFLVRGKGARVWDADGNEYVDYVGSWGPLILGHAHPAVLRAVRAAAADGTTFGAPTEREVELAEAVCRAVPSIERVRFVSSGTEAAMSAIRLARGATGRARILKFEGCYHGHADSLLVGAGSGVATLGIPGSPGVPPELVALTVQAPFNDLDAVADAFRRWPDEIACVLVEPVAGNMGCIPPVAGFLEGLRTLCDAHGALLVFDEVMTGFRVAYGGAQARFGVRPDLTILGKVVGGGLPAAAYGGRAELMGQIAPEGPIYQAGTLSGSPLAMAAGLETLRQLAKPGAYEALEARSHTLADGLAERAAAAGIELTTAAVGGMFGFFFHPGPVPDFATARKASGERFRAFFHALLDAGVYLPPSAYEACFVSLAHRPADVAATLAAAERAFRKLARAGAARVEAPEASRYGARRSRSPRGSITPPCGAKPMSGPEDPRRPSDGDPDRRLGRLRVPDPHAAKRSMASAYQGAIEAVVAMVFCALAGWWIDGRLGSEPIGLFVGMGIGFAAFLLRLLRIKAPTLGKADLPPPSRDEDDDDRGGDWTDALTPQRDDDEDEGSRRQ